MSFISYITSRPIKHSNEFNKHFNVNFICETVTIVESNITFDADFSRALSLPCLWACQKCMPFSVKSKLKPPQFTFTAKFHINQNVLAHSVSRIVCLLKVNWLNVLQHFSNSMILATSSAIFALVFPWYYPRY